MKARPCRLCCLVALAGVLAGGCSGPPGPAPAADEEAQVRERFAEFQAAVKAGDADRLWTLLDPKSRADAERAAESVRTSYAAAGAADKAKLEEALGLTGAELTALSGPGYLKTKRFRRKYDEIPESKITRVTAQDGKATVYFDEPDGDHEKALFTRQDGQWRLWLTIPKTAAPQGGDK